MITPDMAIDRALERLPAGEQRERIAAALVDDAGEDGQWPRYSDLSLVYQLTRRGPQDIAAVTGLPIADAEWLIAQLSTAPPSAPPAKRKGGWPKGRPRNARPLQPEA